MKVTLKYRTHVMHINLHVHSFKLPKSQSDTLHWDLPDCIVKTANKCHCVCVLIFGTVVLHFVSSLLQLGLPHKDHCSETHGTLLNLHKIRQTFVPQKSHLALFYEMTPPRNLLWTDYRSAFCKHNFMFLILFYMSFYFLHVTIAFIFFLF